MKVLLIEDEIKVADSLIQGLRENDFVVDHAENGTIGLEMALINAYDIIISDIVMPSLSGFELTTELRKQDVKTPILLLSALGDPENKIIGLDSGADDYLVKPFYFKELLARIKALHRRKSGLFNEKNQLRYDDLVIFTEAQMVKRNNLQITLTNREFALLEYLVRNAERVISKSELAENVWEIDFETNTNFIEVYINYLRAKIDKPFTTKLIHTVFGSGYVLKNEISQRSQ